MSPQRHILSLKRFAKLIGFKTARASGFRRVLEDLKTLKAIEIQQSGYAAHSEYHPKLVVIRDMQRIQDLHVPSPSSRRSVSMGKRVKNIVIRTAQVISKRLDMTVLLRVVGKQESPGIYLHIPKDHVEAYGIEPGDRVEVQLVRVFSVVWA